MVAVKNQDNREHDIFDSDDYFQEHGGMIASIRAITGKNPKKLFGDTSDPENPKVRDLEDEAKRVFRARVINPKWINSMKRHGYKGAFELASTVDFIFGYDATAQIMEDWMYNELAEKYALELKEFFKENNPWALKDIIERLLEAHERGLWKNPKDEILERLKKTYLELEDYLE
ncbi:Aerobic cobaltochelatase subunit CobN [archaeon HR06]|nr:Aerobic cobaltochelatase subunit CobN [archaeon HR06]